MNALPFLPVLAACLMALTPFMMMGAIVFLFLNRAIGDEAIFYRPIVLAGCVVFTIHLFLSLLAAYVLRADLFRISPAYLLWLAVDVIVMTAAIVSSARKFRSLAKVHPNGVERAG